MFRKCPEYYLIGVKNGLKDKMKYIWTEREFILFRQKTELGGYRIDRDLFYITGRAV